MTSFVLAAVIAASPGPHRLKWDPRIDLPVTAVLGAGWLVSEFAVKAQLAPDACRWCATNAFDTGVRRLFNPTLEPSASGLRPAATASDLIGFVGVPLIVAGLDASLNLVVHPVERARSSRVRCEEYTPLSWARWGRSDVGLRRSRC